MQPAQSRSATFSFHFLPCLGYTVPAWRARATVLPRRPAGEPIEMHGIEPRQQRSVETRTSWVVAGVSVGLLGMSFGAPWITAVALKSIAAEMGEARSVPALASALAWFGAAVGGILMGRIAEQ